MVVTAPDVAVPQADRASPQASSTAGSPGRRLDGRRSSRAHGTSRGPHPEDDAGDADHQREDREEQRHSGRRARGLPRSCSCAADVACAAPPAAPAAAGEGQHGSRVLGLGLPLDGRLDPGRLATVAVTLHQGEGQRGRRRGTDRPTGRTPGTAPGPMPPPAAAANSTTETRLADGCRRRRSWAGRAGSSSVVAVQPGTGCALTEASGGSAGNWMRTCTVLAVSLSFGTRKVTLP